MPINTLIFDFGNVLLTLDEQKTINGFNEILDPQKIGDIQENCFEPFERGEISEESFFNRLQRRSKKVFTGDIYYSLWNSMLGSFPPHRIQSLQEWRKKYTVILLSNTNITHLRYVKYKIELENGLTDFHLQCFDKAYFSHEIKMRKPEKRIYEFVLQENNLLAEECLFIDDKLENIEGATSIGIHGYLHDPKNEIFELLDQILAKI